MATTSNDDVVQAGQDLWTVDDVAAYFRVTTRTVREWRTVEATFPPPLDLPGRSVRWYGPDVTAWALSSRERSA